MSKRRTFSREFKIEAVKLVTQQGYDISPARCIVSKRALLSAAASLTPNGEESVYAAARDACAMTSFYTTTFMLHGHTGGGIGEIWRNAAMGLLHDKTSPKYREFNIQKEMNPGRPLFTKMTFKDRGLTGDGLWIWSGDTLMDLGRYQALKMTVKTIDGSDYLLIEAGGFSTKKSASWQSPLYVMKRVGK